MNYKVYVLFSKKLKKYYVGYTKDLEDRLIRHNTGRSRFTSKGIPWEMIKFYSCETRKEAITLERRIKGRGVTRFLEEN